MPLRRRKSCDMLPSMLEKLFPTTRLEAFSDGVLAVIITIMVLELKVPHENGITGLVSIAPTLFVYFLSFSFTAIYWVNHHQLIHRVEQCDHRVLYANLAYLFAASLLPFFTAYVIEKGSDSFSVALYAASMIFTGFCFFLLRISIERLLGQNREPALRGYRHPAQASRESSAVCGRRPDGALPSVPRAGAYHAGHGDMDHPDGGYLACRYRQPALKSKNRRTRFATVEPTP